MCRGTVPLLNDEKERIAGEFTNFILHAQNEMKLLKESLDMEISQTKLWYELLTKVDCFKNYKQFINFALKFLNRIMAVEVSNLEDINSKKRPLEHKNVEMLNFISSNGPDPLLSMGLVDSLVKFLFWEKLALCLGKFKAVCFESCG